MSDPMSAPTASPAPGRPALVLLAAVAGRWPALVDRLRAGGHRVERVDTADAAVERALAEDVDLLLLDASLGGIGALAAADILRRLGRALRLVALDELPVPGEALPFDARLHAACDPGEVDAEVARALRAADAAFVASQDAALAEAVDALGADFEASLPASRAAIAEALAADDLVALRAACHRLRGGARTFGRAVLGELATRVELAVDAGRRDEALEAGGRIVGLLGRDTGGGDDAPPIAPAPAPDSGDAR